MAGRPARRWDVWKRVLRLCRPHAHNTFGHSVWQRPHVVRVHDAICHGRERGRHGGRYARLPPRPAVFAQLSSPSCVGPPVWLGGFLTWPLPPSPLSSLDGSDGGGRPARSARRCPPKRPHRGLRDDESLGARVWRPGFSDPDPPLFRHRATGRQRHMSAAIARMRKDAGAHGALALRPAR